MINGWKKNGNPLKGTRGYTKYLTQVRLKVFNVVKQEYCAHVKLHEGIFTLFYPKTK